MSGSHPGEALSAEAPKARAASRLGQIVRLGIGAAVIGLLSIVFTISFAALVYTGPLAPYFGEGITLALAGAIVIALVGCMTFSTQGLLCSPQDITALLLAGSALAIAGEIGHGPALFPTIVMLTICASAGTGIVLWAVGRLKLGGLVRYVPYPVVAGFLAATGYLLAVGGLGIATRESLSLTTLAPVLAETWMPLWLPWVLGAALLVVLERSLKSSLVMPLALVVAAGLFYLFLWALGGSVATARAQGLLLGPFGEFGLGQVLDPARLMTAEWAVLPGQLPAFIAIAALAMFGALMNSSGVELSRGEESDTDRDLQATGLANLATAGVGGLPGFIVIGESLLAGRLGLGGRWPGLVAAAAMLAALLFGADLLALLPAGFLAMVVIYLGFDLLVTWVWQVRARISGGEYLVVLTILAIAATAGFLTALGVGTLVAAAIFVLNYAKTGVVRLRTTGATRRSRVERSQEAEAILAEAGRGTVVLELAGYLFFGTANGLARQALAEIAANPKPRHLVLDFQRVPGMDASAAAALVRIADDAGAAGVALVLSGLDAGDWDKIRRVRSAEPQATRHPSLDAALEEIEEALLAEAGFARTDAGAALQARVSALEAAVAHLPGAVTHLSLAPGETLISAGEASEDIYVLMRGTLSATVKGPDGQPVRVARFYPCAVVGEIAHYAGVPRSARVTADAPSEVTRIDFARIGETARDERAALHEEIARALARRVLRMNGLLTDAGL